MRRLFFLCSCGGLFSTHRCPMDGWGGGERELAQSVFSKNTSMTAEDLVNAGIDEHLVKSIVIIESHRFPLSVEYIALRFLVRGEGDLVEIIPWIESPQDIREQSNKIQTLDGHPLDGQS